MTPEEMDAEVAAVWAASEKKERARAMQYRHYTGLSKDRLYRILYEHVTKSQGGYGGGMFGWDWPTLRVLYPRITVTMENCLEDN